MMKLFRPLICYLILLLATNAVSLSPPGLHTSIDGDSAGTTIIHSEVYFDNLTRILIFDDYVKVDTDEHIIASIGKLNTSVSVNASSRGAKDISGPGSAIFTGGFGILEIDYNSVQLNLVPDSNKSVVITVTNNTDAQVQWQSHDGLVMITHINHWRAGHAEYEVRVRSVEGLKDKVIISTASNGQRVEIDVKYEADKTINITSHDEFFDVCNYILFLTFGTLICCGCRGCVRDYRRYKRLLKIHE